ncbi:MAG TPA: carboxypeptidase-like regulatory domain-containing protein [Longimicrobium sp.]|nr:carboxypeptidase-like regulatory domain-containing protein [Longimicrobium sp.]
MQRIISRIAPAAAVLALLAAPGCLPIPWTMTLSPDIDGRFLDEAGQPVAGARVALSTASSDSTCANPALNATTDADGRFAFPARKQRQKFIILLPIDYFIAYRLCAGDGPPFRPGYVGSGGIGSVRPDSLVCRPTVMAPSSSAPLTCDSRRRRGR